MTAATTNAETMISVPNRSRSRCSGSLSKLCPPPLGVWRTVAQPAFNPLAEPFLSAYAR